MNTKTCTKCNSDLPLTEYYVIKKTGYMYNYCKQCHYKMTKPKAKAWREKYPERWLQDVAKAQKDWRERLDGGVYLLVTTDGLYVGQSSMLQYRLNQHIRDAKVGIQKLKNTKLLYTRILEIENDEEKRIFLEKKYIRLLKPELNFEYNDMFKKVDNKYVKK